MAESGGLMESLRRLADTLLAILQTRLELLSNELEEERLRIAQMLLYGSVALFFFGLAIMILTAFFVVLFWDSHRLLVLGGFAALYFVAGLLVWNALRRMAREKSKLFSSSLAELADDRDLLAPRP
ncbi:MAG: phage holin family protein [Gallionella sp.]|nr:phage holin family protein [Gallionella sp.]